MLRIAQALETQLRGAMQRAFPEADAGLDPQLAAASKPEFGDFQANGALPLAKPLKQAPRQIATAIVEQLQADPAFTDLCLEPQIAGPGLHQPHDPSGAAGGGGVGTARRRASRRASGQQRGTGGGGLFQPQHRQGDACGASALHDHWRLDCASAGVPRPSGAAPQSRGRLGHPVRHAHHHLKQVAPEALETADAVDLGDLVAFYREAKKRFDEDEAFQSTSRDEVVKLQGGDPVSLKAWGLLCDQSRREFQKIYDRLDIRLSERGESFYNPFLPAVIDGLKAAELLVTDDGAQCVFLEGVQGKDGKPLPVIVQKSDGGFNYATTDLAPSATASERFPEGMALAAWCTSPMPARRTISPGCSRWRTGRLDPGWCAPRACALWFGAGGGRQEAQDPRRRHRASAGSAR